MTSTVLGGSAVLRAPRLRPEVDQQFDGGLRLTQHASQRMREFGVTTQMVVDAYRGALQTWPARGGCVEYVGDAIILTVDPARRLAVTVKLRTGSWYVHGTHHLGHLPG